AQPGPLFLHHPPPLVELRPGRHQRVAVVKRPAVELRVRELDAKPTPRELQRVRAVGTLERTAVGQLGEEPERLRRHGVESNPPGIPKTTSPFAASASRNPATSCWTPSTP